MRHRANRDDIGSEPILSSVPLMELSRSSMYALNGRVGLVTGGGGGIGRVIAGGWRATA